MHNLTPVVAFLVAAGLFCSVGPRLAEACSAGPEFNPAAESDVVIAGRVTNMELLRFSDIQRFIDVELTFEVDRYLMGQGPRTLLARDGASVEPGLHQARSSAELAVLDIEDVDVDRLRFSGRSGSCGGLYTDPRGKYFVLGLSRHPEGYYVPHLLSVFGVGSGPSDPQVVAGIDRAERLLLDAGIRPASTGSAGLGDAAHTGVPTSLVLLFVIGFPAAGRLFVALVPRGHS